MAARGAGDGYEGNGDDFLIWYAFLKFVEAIDEGIPLARELLNQQIKKKSTWSDSSREHRITLLKLSDPRSRE